ncbi:hypothetical protein [Pseudomonas sp. NA-150]|uniref:hypothetical protein n=1 Tax=Pseudomonas sp. NA-150 TaxID=3367525 RepID=UPI0037C75186
MSTIQLPLCPQDIKKNAVTRSARRLMSASHCVDKLTKGRAIIARIMGYSSVHDLQKSASQIPFRYLTEDEKSRFLAEAAMTLSDLLKMRFAECTGLVDKLGFQYLETMRLPKLQEQEHPTSSLEDRKICAPLRRPRTKKQTAQQPKQSSEAATPQTRVVIKQRRQYALPPRSVEDASDHRLAPLIPNHVEE